MKIGCQARGGAKLALNRNFAKSEARGADRGGAY